MSAIHEARSVYESLPTPLKNAGGALARHLPVRMRYGSAFSATSRLLAGADSRTREEIEALADERLGRVLEAASRAPYWARVFADAGFDPRRASAADLTRLPLLDKEAIRQNVDSMLDPQVPPDARKWVTTGGTSGRPLGLWIDRDASAADWAFVVAAWGRVGFRLDEKRVVLRGRRLGRNEQRATFEYEPLRRELYVSVFDLDTKHMAEIRGRVRSFGARFLHGYPSAFEVLGRGFADAGEQPPRFEALFAVSENLYPGQRERLEELFDARVFSFYGMSEKVAFAAECEHSTELHVDSLYGITELVGENGELIDEPGVRGEIVSTGLLSASMPLLRYRTGDFAAWSDGECACGRPYRRWKAVEGRWVQEQLVTATGSTISMTAINVHSAVFDTVRRFRFVQDRAGEVSLLVEPGPGFDDSARTAIIDELSGKLGGQIELRVDVIDALPLTEIGKHRFIEQRIPGTNTSPRPDGAS